MAAGRCRCFLTPYLQPFFAARYSPPQDTAACRGSLASCEGRGGGPCRSAWRNPDVGRRDEEQLKGPGTARRLRGGELDMSVLDTGVSQSLALLRFHATAAWRRRPQIPASAMDIRVLRRHHARTRESARHEHGSADARQDGYGRHLRPPRRRLRAVFDRRPLARAPLREDL